MHMKRPLTFLFLGLSAPPLLLAQTSDLVFFTDDGTRFTLIVDGDQKNAEPATRVVATGIRTESPMVIVRFEDLTIPQIRKPGYFPLGKEYTVMITTNKKGERVLRPTGEAELGTAAKTEPPAKPKPADFGADQPASISGATQQTTVGGVDQITTVTVVEETTGGGSVGGTTQGVSINMGVNGMGVNMNVAVTDGTMGTMGTTTSATTTTTRTTTTTTSGTTGTLTTSDAASKPVRTEAPYRMPGYTGPIGCPMPMSAMEYAEVKKSIESKSFEDTKMTLAKQVGRDRCFSTDQVKGIMGLFSFEDSKLDFAKYAYDRTHDIGNYFKVNDAFTFESSVDDLNDYIRSR
jgi:hypothetical protein